MISLYLAIPFQILALQVTTIPTTGVPPIPLKATCVAYNSSGTLYVFGGHEKSNLVHNEVYIYNLTSQYWAESTPIDQIFPTPRYNPGCFVYGESLYIYGGNSNYGPLHDMWAYHWEEMYWEPVTTKGPPSIRYLFAYISYTYQGNPYFAVFGGWKDSGLSNGLYILDIKSLTWAKMQESSYKLASASMVFYNKTLLVIGGVAENNLLNSIILQFDLPSGTWTYLNCLDWVPRSHFGAAVLNNEIYAFFGWNDLKNLYESSIHKITISPTCTSVEISKIQDKNLLVFNYGFAYTEKKAYLFGGYTSAGITNSFSEFSCDSLTFSLVTKDYPSPKKLMNASLIKINTCLYLFGGMYGDLRYNELWRFSIDLGTWTKLKSFGDIPNPRSHHGAGSDGDIMFVFGGKDSIIYFNDLYQFNTITSTWTKLLYYSSINPSPRFGSCIAVQIPIVYIYGGETRSGLSSDFFIYNISSSTYKQLSSSPNFTLGNGQSCYLTNDHKNIQIVNGLSDGDAPLGYVQNYNIVNTSWSTLYDSQDEGLNRARPVIGKVGSGYYVIAGCMWANKVNKEIIRYDLLSKTAKVIDSVSQVFYQAPFAQYKSFVFVYGGGSSYNELIRYDTGTRGFYYFDLLGVCSDDCSLVCAPGSFYNNTSKVCELCKKGSYAEGYGSLNCTACEPGTYNSIIGASSPRQCYPCEKGYYNDKYGASVCFECPKNYNCPPGSQVPSVATYYTEMVSSQPDPYKYNTAQSDDLILLLQIIIISISFLAFLIVLVLPRLRSLIKSSDIFIASHNHNFNVPLIHEKTFTGGFFTLFYYIVAAIILIRSVVPFVFDNISENKTLIPLVVLKETTPSIHGNLFIRVKLSNYGGFCGNYTCSEDVFYMVSKITVDRQDFTCVMIEDDCYLYLNLINAEVEASTTIIFSLQEENSFASQISVNLTADSSIPGENSSLFLMNFPNPGLVYRGGSASLFSFTLTSSYFESLVDGSTGTGFHVAATSNPVDGSSYLPKELSFSSNLNIQLVVLRSLNALVTRRSLNNTLFYLVLTLVGSIPGFKGILEAALKLLEKACLRLRKKYEKRANVVKVVDERVKRSQCFEDRVEENDIGNIAGFTNVKETSS